MERLQPHTVDYLKELLGAIQEGSHEEKNAMINQLLEEIKGKEYRVVVNPRCSKIVETVLHDFTEVQLQGLLRPLQPHIVDLMLDRCASHVIQELFRTITLKADLNAIEFDDRSTLYLLSELQEVLAQQWWSISENVYGSHIVRIILQTPKLDARLGVSHELAATLHRRCNDAPFLRSSLSNDMLSRVIQQLSQCQDVSDRVLQSIIENSSLHDLVKNPTASKAIECCIESASMEVYTALRKHMCKTLKQDAAHPIANHVIQKLVAHCKSKKDFKRMHEILEDSIPDLMKSGKKGVVLKLLEAGLKWSSKKRSSQLIRQVVGENVGQFIQKVCSPNAHILDAFLFQAVVSADDDTSTAIIQSFFALPVVQVVPIMQAKLGSRNVEAVLQAPGTKVEDINRLCSVLKGRWGSVAGNVYGSHVFQSIYHKADAKCQKEIKGELSRERAKLHGSAHGRRILHLIGQNDSSPGKKHGVKRKR